MSKNTKNTTRFISLRKTVKDDAILLFRALFHKKVSVLVKVLIVAILIYIASPLDIIPDWLPLFGVLDDITLIVLFIKWIKKLIPENLQDELLGNVLLGK